MSYVKSPIRTVPVAVLIVANLCMSGCSRSKPVRPSADAGSRRTTLSGEVVGFVGPYGNHTWRGIPFATPPIGALRWRAPQPPESWTGTREALDFGSPCTQFASPIGGVNTAKAGEPVGSEDCLYLNVYAPRVDASELPRGDARWPVMVWIHGGGNSIGEAAFYDGGNLAQTHKVVIVAINYRLGPFGWFRHAALRDEGSDLDRSGNFGTLDLVRALEWVRDNAGAFGGNPNNVTIFGESAGGANVYSLLLSPQAHGLFHRAIVESGGLFMNTPTEAEAFSDDAASAQRNSSNDALLQLLIKDGRARDRATAKAHLATMSAGDVEHYLRGKTNFEILTAYKPMPGIGMIDMPKVFREGVVLPQDEPMQRLARVDGYNRVPVILGTNRDENKLFMFGDPKWVRRYFWIVPRLRDATHYNLSAEYLAKMWKANGVDEPATAMRAAQGPSVFAYRFDWDEEPRVLGAELSEMLGAAHGFEIPFVFGHFDLGRAGNIIYTSDNEPGRKDLSAQMMSYWAEFAYHGAPGRGRDGRQPDWTPWDSETATSPKFVVLDTPAGGGVRMSSEAVTTAGVLAAIDDDPRLPTQRDKCMIYYELANRARGFTKQEYPSAGKQGCKEYPFETYPWG
ncbi:MAG TPA: carboxylesterase family protein [Candidatus Kryptonia bacterium]|nr:carboxylesterase family protein [Candidatus Kryptonia bacterium]